MEDANRIVEYKPDPRATAFDDFRTKRNKQDLDTVPFHCLECWDCKNCF